MCECCESRKNQIDDARLNPKRYIIGNQQPMPKGKVQRSFLLREVGTSVPKWVGPNVLWRGIRYDLHLHENVRSL